MLDLVNRTASLIAAALFIASSAVAAPVANSEMRDTSGHRSWTTSYAECWQDPRTATGLSSCGKDVVPDRITIMILFEFDKFLVPQNVVNRDALVEIDGYIDQVKRSPAREYVTIVGHTDAKGSDAYNMALGMRRAQAVRDYFIARGYPENLLAPAESRGKRELLPNYSPFAVQQRRVVITKEDR
jgi:OOP family OmpA-OmpF porin